MRFDSKRHTYIVGVSDWADVNCRCVRSRRLALNEDRRRSTLTSTTTGQLLTSQQQQNISLDELMSRAARSASLAPTTPDTNSTVRRSIPHQ